MNADEGRLAPPLSAIDRAAHVALEWFANGRSSMKPALVYSTGMCPYCFLAKRLLERRGIPYTEHRMRRSERSRLAPLGGGLTYPQIVFGDRVVDGWTELRRLDRTGELARITA